MAYPSHDAMRRALMAGAFACATLAGATHAQQPSGHTPASATQPRPPQPGQPDTDPKVQNVEKSGASRTAPPGRIESNRKAGDDSGTESRDALKALGYPVEWHTYAMEHSVCPQEVADLNTWLVRVLAAS